jgi:hypothetical protein
MLASQLQVTPPMQRITPCHVYTQKHSFAFHVPIYSFLSVQVFQLAVIIFSFNLLIPLSLATGM